MMKKFTIKAVVFDFDGTLAETNRLHYDAFREVLSGKGVDLSEEEMAPLFGVSALEIMRLLKRRHSVKGSPETLLKEKTRAYAKLLKKARLRDGAVKALKDLKGEGFKLAVWTGALKGQSKKILGKNARFFSLVIDSTDLKRGKPYPDGLRLIARKLRVKTGEIAMVGDSEKDVQAARSAGALPIGIPADMTLELMLKSRPPIIITRLGELSMLFRRSPQIVEL